MMYFIDIGSYDTFSTHVIFHSRENEMISVFTVLLI
jgi:hypothetical protein